MKMQKRDERIKDFPIENLIVLSLRRRQSSGSLRVFDDDMKTSLIKELVNTEINNATKSS